MKSVKLWLLAGVVLTVISPFIFTRTFGIINFQETGPIGDTIGGITAPITNLIGAILVFYALRAQIDANELVRKQFEQQQKEENARKKLFYLAENINTIRNDINDFSYTSNTKTTITEGGVREVDKEIIPYKGASAFSAYIKVLPNLINYYSNQGLDPFESLPKLFELEKLLEMINNIIDSVNTADISNEDKKYFMSVVAYQYISKIKPAFNSKIQEYKSIPTHLTFKSDFGESESVFTDRIWSIISSIDSKIL
ncbi:hypothetical protein E5K00_00625 [Hymenobacter aquaticus]|uniref:Phage abortive infection protein n=1 Tax=Hymenobacter aquaticus TaxID=1867101 RepID=A0A4Z0Q3V1_9BACT|nr:hypothetical protein [Hymenobacter aquaticus]TGE23751.1 hypothetical protein E5K00_00625 [Hymenobacter aquaticus]